MYALKDSGGKELAMAEQVAPNGVEVMAPAPDDLPAGAGRSVPTTEAAPGFESEDRLFYPVPLVLRPWNVTIAAIVVGEVIRRHATRAPLHSRASAVTRGPSCDAAFTLPSR